MNVKHTSSSQSPYRKILIWTVLLALVFTAGMLTGQQFAGSASQKPEKLHNSIAEGKVNEASVQKLREPADEQGDHAEKQKLDYSFFRYLSETGPKPAAENPSVGPSDESGKANDNAPAESTDPEQSDSRPKFEPELLSDTDSDRPRFSLQIGAHATLKGAKKRGRRLYNKGGIKSFVVETKLAGQGTYFRLYTGRFDKFGTAEAQRQTLLEKTGLYSTVSKLSQKPVQ